jgi:hypothetical protein
MTEQVWEGTWEEIKKRGEGMANRRVRLVLLPGGADEQTHSADGDNLAQALAGLIGSVDSSEYHGGVVSRLSEDEESFGRYLEQRHAENER